YCEIVRPGGAEVGNHARDVVPRTVRQETLLAAGEPPSVPDTTRVHSAAPPHGVLSCRFVAVERVRGDAEQILHREGNAGGLVVLQLRERDEDVRIRVGVVKLEVLEEVPARRYRQPGIAFAASQVARVLELDSAEAHERLHVPARGRDNLLEGPVVRRRLDEAHPLRTLAPENGRDRT